MSQLLTNQSPMEHPLLTVKSEVKALIVAVAIAVEVGPIEETKTIAPRWVFSIPRVPTMKSTKIRKHVALKNIVKSKDAITNHVLPETWNKLILRMSKQDQLHDRRDKSHRCLPR